MSLALLIKAGFLAVADSFNAVIPRLIPAAGAAGQVLRKATAADNAVAWSTVNEVPGTGTTGHVLQKTASGFAWGASVGVLPTGGATATVLKKTGTGNYAATWQVIGELPTGGAIGQVFKKTAATNFVGAWSTPAEVPAGGAAGQVLGKASAADQALAWLTLIGLPSGGATGQIPVKTAGGYGWTSPPPGSGTFAVPSGGSAGMQLVKLSSADGDVGWAVPASGGGSGSSSGTASVSRGFTSNKVSTTENASNSVGGIGYTIFQEGGGSVVGFEDVGTEQNSTAGASIPNLTMLKTPPGFGFNNISISLGHYSGFEYARYLFKNQVGSFLGRVRFSIEQKDANFGNFFTGLISGPTAANGGVRGWEYLNGTSNGLAGIGFEPSDSNVQFVYYLGDSVPVVRINSGLARTTFLSAVHEAKFALNPAKTHILASIVAVPSGTVVAGPQALPLMGNNTGYTMTYGRGTDFQSPYAESKYAGLSWMIMETDY